MHQQTESHRFVFENAPKSMPYYANIRSQMKTGDFAWIAAPQALSKEALWRAQSFFGEWTYSSWQAFTGWLGRLSIGKDLRGQCAEFVLTVLNDCEHLRFTQPTATPQGVADAALMEWQTPLLYVSNPKRDGIDPPDLG